MKAQINKLYKKRQKCILKKDWSQALDYTDKMMMIAPNAIRLHNRGLILAKMGKFDEAVYELEKAFCLSLNYKIKETLFFIRDIQQQVSRKRRKYSLHNLQNNITVPFLDLTCVNNDVDCQQNKISFGKYKVVKKISTSVYLAEDFINRKVAIKVISSKNEDLLQRFFREAESLAKISHPNIVAIHGIEKTQQHYIFSMDYVKSISFLKYLEIKSLPFKYEILIERLMSIFEKVARAVDYVHEKGIFHRNLTLESILIRLKDEEPVIIDFNLARDEQNVLSLSKEGVLLGTPMYMSPEQLQGKNEIDELSDIYSLGVIIYHLITQQLPFKVRSDYLVTKDILHKQPLRPRKINRKIEPDIENICLKAMAKDRRFRYQSAHELADDINRYLRKEKVGAMPPGIYNHVKKWILRNPHIASGLLIFFTLIISVVLYSYYQSTIILYQTNKALRKAEADKEKNLEMNRQLEKTINITVSNQKKINKMLQQVKKSRQNSSSKEKDIEKLHLLVKQKLDLLTTKQKQFNNVKAEFIKLYIQLARSEDDETSIVGIKKLATFPEHIDLYISLLKEKLHSRSTKVRNAAEISLQKIASHIKNNQLRLQIYDILNNNK